MLEANGGCELPCWWGIVSGETAWQAARDFFASQGIGGIIYAGDLYYYFDPPLSERSVQYNLELHFIQQAEVVHSIQVHSQVLGDPQTNRFAQDWHRYSPDQVLNRYGEPSQVYIQLVPPIEPGSPVYYQLWLAYDHLGFYIVYTGPAAYEPPIMRACPRWEEVTAIALRLQSPRPGESVLESPELLRTLEEASGMNVESFYETFRNAAGDSCIESPAAMWP